MNERIRELALQAEKLADVESKAFTDNTGKWRLIWNEVYDKKFAELIVRECAHLVGGYTKENEFGTDVKEAYEEITKHFGVEE